MKIIIKEAGKEKPMTIRLPLRLFANPLMAAGAAKYSELSYPQAVALMRALKKSSKLLKGTPFVEAHEKDGDEVTVYL